MRTMYLLPAVLLMGLVACNTGTKEAESSDTAHVHNSMNHAMPAADATVAMEAIPAGAKVFFKNLKEGQKVSSPLKVEMGADVGVRFRRGAIVRGAAAEHFGVGEQLAVNFKSDDGFVLGHGFLSLL